MARVAGAKVIVLQSHPVWIAAQQLARERSEAMLRHPSFPAHQRAVGQGDVGIPGSRRQLGRRRLTASTSQCRYLRRGD